MVRTDQFWREVDKTYFLGHVGTESRGTPGPGGTGCGEC